MTSMYTNEQCIGCNKCVKSCPYLGANIIRKEDNKVKIDVNLDLCMSCGACLSSCIHNARNYTDDTEKMFSQVKEEAERFKKYGETYNLLFRDIWLSFIKYYERKNKSA